MRRLRWKSKYATGNRRVDEHHKALVDMLLGIDAELRAKEHCQDMEDLYGELTQMAVDRLAHGGSSDANSSSDGAFQAVLSTSLPLAALDTPACRDCSICNLTEERLGEWLIQGTKLAPSSDRRSHGGHQHAGLSA